MNYFRNDHCHSEQLPCSFRHFSCFFPDCKFEWCKNVVYQQRNNMCNKCFELCLLGDGNPVLICINLVKQQAIPMGNYIIMSTLSGHID